MIESIASRRDAEARSSTLPKLQSEIRNLDFATHGQ